MYCKLSFIEMSIVELNVLQSRHSDENIEFSQYI